ncbi:MAG: 3'-5' exonuclease, partial [Acidimicrobiia bacterium]
GGLRRKRPARSTTPPGDLPAVSRYPSELDEATGIARALRDAHTGGRRWSELAVLYRTNAQSAPFEAALRAAGIPFRVRGAGRFLDRPEVRAALEFLRSRETAAPGAGLAAHLFDLGAWGAEGTEERQAHAEALTRLAGEYLELPPPEGAPTVAGLWAHLGATLAEEDESSPGDRVDLLTFHKSKGLEWDVVFLAGLERGFVPIGYAETPDEQAEERRLLHVAITRARRALRLSWAQRRTLGARSVNRQPSPYLREIEALLETMVSAPSRDVGKTIAATRARLAAEGGRRPKRLLGRLGDSDLEPDATVLRALMEWRRGKARASGVPAFVIFHDVTLAALAEARPSSPGELLAIPGIGPLKAERYGKDLLSVVGACA